MTIPGRLIYFFGLAAFPEVISMIGWLKGESTYLMISSISGTSWVEEICLKLTLS